MMHTRFVFCYSVASIKLLIVYRTKWLLVFLFSYLSAVCFSVHFLPACQRCSVLGTCTRTRVVGLLKYTFSVLVFRPQVLVLVLVGDVLYSYI